MKDLLFLDLFRSFELLLVPSAPGPRPLGLERLFGLPLLSTLAAGRKALEETLCGEAPGGSRKYLGSILGSKALHEMNAFQKLSFLDVIL